AGKVCQPTLVSFSEAGAAGEWVWVSNNAIATAANPAGSTPRMARAGSLCPRWTCVAVCALACAALSLSPGCSGAGEGAGGGPAVVASSLLGPAGAAHAGSELGALTAAQIAAEERGVIVLLAEGPDAGGPPGAHAGAAARASRIAAAQDRVLA